MRKIVHIYIILVATFSFSALADFDFTHTPTELSAHYLADIQTVDNVKSNLLANGFTILSIDEILAGNTIITITNNELKATNSYMSTLHILVNKNNNEIRVQNPSYLGAAYLKGYTYGQFETTLKALEKTLKTMMPVRQKKEFSALPEYHFMFGMPCLNDKVEIKAKEPLSKLSSKKYIAYSLNLPNGSTLVGHKLRSTTYKFLKKIKQSKNTQLLPYESIIKDGKVSILDPKYYLALSLPLLTMSEFMKIASTPNQIEKDIARAYK